MLCNWMAWLSLFPSGFSNIKVSKHLRLGFPWTSLIWSSPNLWFAPNGKHWNSKLLIYPARLLGRKKEGPRAPLLDNPHGASKIISSKLSPHRALPPRHHPCCSLSILTRLKHPGEALNGSLGGGVAEAFKPWACLRQKSFLTRKCYPV